MKAQPAEQHRTALITGASSGIGAAIACTLARQGLHIVLVARRLKRLEHLAGEIRRIGGESSIIQADLAVESQRIRVYEQVSDRFETLEILINNAGLGWYGYYADMPWHVALQVLQVNINAVAHLTGLFLPGMRSRDTGHIINIGSIAGSFPNQGTAIYSASKSFLDAFTSALHRELAGSAVECSVARVGPVATEFFQQAAQQPAGLPVPAQRFAIPADHVAQRVWDLVQRPRKVIYIPRGLFLVPLIEFLFGGIIDRLGPLLLKRATSNV
jgi:short-subunit dehydrogenase